MNRTFGEAWGDTEGSARAREGFSAVFGGPPSGVWAAPGRVNIIGEHTDYNRGLCAPIALPHRTFAALTPSADDVVRLSSAQIDPGRVWQTAMEDVAPGQVHGWGGYVAGVIWGMRRRGFAVPAVTGFVDSCVPFGAGLSSSAALSCVFAVAETALIGLPDSDALRQELVLAAIDAENEIVGAATGGLDQSASLRAEKDHVLIIDFLDFTTRQVPFGLHDAGLELLVIDTKAPHQLNDGQYASRRATCEQAAAQLGVSSLREVSDLEAALAVLGPETVAARRVRHVVTEIQRVRDFEVLAANGRWADMGPLFAASHRSLRFDYEVTVPELDVAVEAATGAGAIAARMTGGGFGGSAIALVPAGESGQVADMVCRAFADRGFAAPAFLMADPSSPAGKVG
ncbi:MAG: galactokinase [Propionibacteriaceae bacterium]|nr:galactokinase [Propionibacteriaceae bacterium]